MRNLLEQLEHDLAAGRCFQRGARIVVAVSGGVDSMVLLYALHALAPKFDWKLTVAHFNHQLRGRSSKADQRLVCATAKQLKLPCDGGSADVRAVAAQQGKSIEMAARDLRHEFLAGCARRHRAKFVALAHHADDQVELFLLRLMRGAGGEGLGGMKSQNPSPADRRVLLMRPLLGFSKDELAKFARIARVRFREDASNASREFERNWVRHELLPLLRRRQPAVGKTILRAMQIAGAEADFVARAAAGWLARGDTNLAPGQKPDFARLHVAAQRQVLQSQIRALGVAPDFQMVEELRILPNRPVSVGSGIELVRIATGIVRRASVVPAAFAGCERKVELTALASSRRWQGMAIEFGGLKLMWRIRRRSKIFSSTRLTGREFFDADKVGAGLVLRHWQAGDRFQPIGLPRATKLQDWFTNRKIPTARRRELVLAETERGELFWVEGERIGEAGKVTAATRRVLELRWKRV